MCIVEVKPFAFISIRPIRYTLASMSDIAVFPDKYGRRSRSTSVIGKAQASVEYTTANNEHQHT